MSTDTHTALSYDKWSHIEGASSDDGDADAVRPLLSGQKSRVQLQADEELCETFKALFKQHFKGRAPLRQRKLLARFISLQHSGPEPSNTFRYSDIIAIVTQVRRRAPARHRRGTDDCSPVANRAPVHTPMATAATQRAHGQGVRCSVV